MVGSRLTERLQTAAGLKPAVAEVIEHAPLQPLSQWGDRLCLLNWNIAKNNHQLDWQRTFAAILRTYQPNLLFLQEARLDFERPEPLFWPNFDRDLETLAHRLGWHFAPNLVHAASGHVFGVLTASETAHLRHATLHTDQGELLLQTPKVALISEYPLAQSAGTLLAINVHGINFVRSHRFLAQLEQIEAAIAHHSGPLILAGDFNTWRTKRMEMLTQLRQRLALQPVIFSPHQDSQLKRFLWSNPLDHVFYRGLTLCPEQTRVLGHVEVSDHKPMVVTFRLE